MKCDNAFRPGGREALSLQIDTLETYTSTKWVLAHAFGKGEPPSIGSASNLITEIYIAGQSQRTGCFSHIPLLYPWRRP